MWCSTIRCIVTLTLSLLVAPLAAMAQPPAHLPTVGWLDEGNWTDKARLYAAFLEGLRALGYVEGQHLVIARRDAEGHLDRLPGLAAELVRLPVDVIVTTGGVPGSPCLSPGLALGLKLKSVFEKLASSSTMTGCE